MSESAKKKKKSKLITYENWLYNNNFSEERCINYWTSVVLSKILCSCDYFCDLQKSPIICTIILLLQCTPNNFICTFMCILALWSLKRESNSGTQLSLRVFRDCNFQVPQFSEASDALSLRLMERSPHKKTMLQLAYSDALLASKSKQLKILKSLHAQGRRWFEKNVWITKLATDAGCAVIALQFNREICLQCGIQHHITRGTP